MHRTTLCTLLLLPFLGGCEAPAPAADLAELSQQVREAEAAFAQSMADRDLEAFAMKVAEDAIFFAGDRPLRGKAAVVAAWTPFFAGEQAPFSWSPEQVEVTDSGTLAYSEGPVATPDGTVVARFRSVWRREAPGVWRVVFDKGCERCRCPVAADAAPAA